MNSIYPYMIKSALSRLRTKLSAIYHKIVGYPMVYNAIAGDKNHSKRVLLVYLIKPFRLPNEKRKSLFRKHQNWWQNVEIAKILDSFGYTVDVIHFQDTRRTLKNNYDLLLGMGPACRQMAKLIPKGVPKIYIATGSETGFNNAQEMKRIAGVASRRGCNLKPSRIAKFVSSDLKYFDSIACFGNKFTASTYQKYHGSLYTFNNHGYSDIDFYKKDFEHAKYSFLYFNSFGHVHKGLDLLLEIFPRHPRLHLYICASFQQEPDFVACYKKELFETSNIHLLGYVNVPGPDFKSVCEKSAYTILPSCAEGQSGSAVVCMHAGLIPIVSKECGIDTNDFGITLKSCDIDEIENTVTNLANMPPEWHRRKSEKTREIALKHYSEEAFKNRLKEILNKNILMA